MTGQSTAPAAPRSAPAGGASRAKESRFLRAVTEVSAPPVIAAVILPVLGAAGPGPVMAGLLWGLLAGVMVGLVPYAVVIWKVRQGRLKDRMLTDRRQRHLPNLLAISSGVIGLGVLLIGHAPVWVSALTASAILTQVVASLIALVWKMSMHLMTNAGIAYLVAAIWSPWTLLVSLPLVFLVAYSRVTLREHTVAQVVVGATLGGGMLSGFFLLFAHQF